MVYNPDEIEKELNYLQERDEKVGMFTETKYNKNLGFAT